MLKVVSCIEVVSVEIQRKINFLKKETLTWSLSVYKDLCLHVCIS